MVTTGYGNLGNLQISYHQWERNSLKILSLMHMFASKCPILEQPWNENQKTTIGII